jgi:peptide/nickel transport system permease protein
MNSVFVRLIFRRLALAILMLWLVSLVVFLAVHVLPGNVALAILGTDDHSPAAIAFIQHALHLNEPLYTQYLRWIGGVAVGNLGSSAATVGQSTVSAVISQPLQNSAFLLLVSAVVMVPLSIGIGVWTACRRDRAADHALTTTMLAFLSLPEFVISIMLVLLLSISVFHLFPAVSLVPPGTHPWQDPAVIVLPCAALVLGSTPYVSRIMRGSMVEVLESDYVAMARLKGLSERRVIWAHAVPNAIIPAIQAAAIAVGWMAGGVVLVEYVFNYPGLGSALVSAVEIRDLPVVQAATLFIAAFYIVVNLLADIMTIALTPRLRTPRQ